MANHEKGYIPAPLSSTTKGTLCTPRTTHLQGWAETYLAKRITERRPSEDLKTSGLHKQTHCYDWPRKEAKGPFQLMDLFSFWLGKATPRPPLARHAYLSLYLYVSMFQESVTFRPVSPHFRWLHVLLVCVFLYPVSRAAATGARACMVWHVFVTQQHRRGTRLRMQTHSSSGRAGRSVCRAWSATRCNRWCCPCPPALCQTRAATRSTAKKAVRARPSVRGFQQNGSCMPGVAAASRTGSCLWHPSKIYLWPGGHGVVAVRGKDGGAVHECPVFVMLKT